MENVFDRAKAFTGLNTTEEVFEITTQPSELCPQIDDLIYSMSERLDTLKELGREVQRLDCDDADALASDILWYSDNKDHRFELDKLREQIVLLRDWGQGWKDLAKKLITSPSMTTELGRVSNHLTDFEVNDQHKVEP